MTRHRIYVNGKVHVRKRRCRTCIFGAASPVSIERRDSMIAECGDQGVIPCHTHLYEDAEIEPVCRGFADLGITIPLRLAALVDVIEYVS